MNNIDKYIKEIEEFDNNQNDSETRTNYYRKVFETCVDNENIDCILEFGKYLINKIDNNKEYYLIKMDILVLTAIKLYFINDKTKSFEYFNKSISHGEKYLEEAKKHSYDELCCAYAWLGLIYKEKNEYDKALTNYNRIIELHEEVKDLPNFYEKHYSYEGTIKEINNIKDILKRE